MKRIVRIGMVLILAAVFMAQVAFARESVSVVKLNQVRQIDSALTMYVSMSDNNGSPCTGNYEASQFSISVDGKALDVDSVQAFDPAVQGIHYVFSVDVSRSLTNDMIQNVRTSLHAFVDGMGPHDTVSLITFGEHVTQRIMNSADREEIKVAIEGIQADEGMTALYKGVIDAVALAGSTGGRSAVIVITDGKNDPTEEMMSYTKDSIYESVEKAQVPLYCIGLNDNDGVDTDSLIELATVTGGDQFVIRADEVSDRVNRIRDIMHSALILNATLVNTDNKAGFDEISTFKVGFQPKDGAFVTSNELQQNVNWKNVPAPEVSPSPTPIPQIALSLDEAVIKYVPGSKVTISGAIEVEQGVVEPEDLSISVNGESWWSTMMRNGNGYTFSAEGALTENTEVLEVKAEIKEMGIASRIQRLNVEKPTPEPTSTPAPVLSVELDDSGRGIMFEPGKVLTISGVINVQGEINPADLVLYVNGETCDMTVMQINRSQYEFTADYVQKEGATELSVQVMLADSEIYTRVQRLFFVTPSPTPSPELYFSLNDSSIVYLEGEKITISGNIEILAGEVAPEDLALYVNNVRWDMKLNKLGDGTYGFEAENTLLDTDITQLDVKVRLYSNTKIVSNSEKLAVSTPEPTATPSPTPRPVVTPPPTAVPVTPPPTPVVTATVVPEPTSFMTDIMDKVEEIVNPLIANGTIWYVAGAAALVLILIIVLIVLAVAKKKKNKNVIEPLSQGSSNFYVEPRDGDLTQGKTTREGDMDATIRDDRNGRKESDFVSDDDSFRGGSDSFVSDEPSKGTVRIDKKGVGTIRLDEVTGDMTARHEAAPGVGTVRIEETSGTMRIDAEPAGTMRIDDEPVGTMRIEEEIKSVNVRLEELRNRVLCETRSINLKCDDELVFGRADSADVVINDSTVSSRHMKITYNGENVYIVDLGSTNGTKINGESVVAREQRRVIDGDTILIGKTTLKLHIDE